MLNRTLFPIGGQDVYCCMELYLSDNQDLLKRYYPELGNNDAIVRLILWEKDPNKPAGLIDVKEQMIKMPFDTRTEFIQAYKKVALEVLKKYDSLETLLPSDLLNKRIWEVLVLGTLKTQEQFEKALRTKKRLGRFL